MDSDDFSEDSSVSVMAGESSATRNRHIAVLAFPFGSHPRALLNLVCKAAKADPNLQFSFFNTEKSNKKLFPPLSNTKNIKAYNVSDGFEKGRSLSGNVQEELELFVESTPANFTTALDSVVSETGMPICCLLTDAFLAFAGDIADALNVPWLPLWAPAPYCLTAHIYTDVIYQLYKQNSDNGNGNDDVPIDIPGLSVMRSADLREQLVLGSDSPPLFYRMLHKLTYTLPKATAVILSSYEQVNDPLLTSDLKSKFRALLYVGFLTVSIPRLPPSVPDTTGCLSWLDRQKDMSVVYISFGTVVKLPAKEVSALAEALEESGIPFVWSISEEMKKLLTEKFIENTRKQGELVVWAPQTEVLGHKSVGVHVTHCGYQSMFESIVGGVPLICRPFWGDHFMNATMADKVWGIGLRVEGDVLTKTGLVGCFNDILDHENGRIMRDKIRILNDLLMDAATPNSAAARDFRTLMDLIQGK